MPVVKNGDIHIYYEVSGEGTPLVLGHGLTGSGRTWRGLGFTDSLKNDFQLITFDARGHGRSDKPHDPAAYGANMADDVVAILDDVGIDKAHYFGYSMGARIGFRLAVRHPERFASFLLGAVSPYRTEVDIQVGAGLLEAMKALLADPEGFVSGMEQLMGRSLASDMRKTLLTNDAEALIAVVESFGDLLALTDDDLSQISVPCFLFCGDLDPRHAGAEEGAAHMPEATFVSMPGLDHMALGRINLELPPPVWARVLPVWRSILPVLGMRG